MDYINYNKTRHVELYNENQQLKKKNSSLSKENENKYIELLGYNAKLAEHHLWKNRRTYFSLINYLLDGEIDGNDFSEEFFRLYSRDNNSISMSENPNDLSDGFSRYTEKIFFCCEDFDEESVEYGEKWLKNEMSNILVEMKNKY